MKPTNILICFLILVVLVLLFARSCNSNTPEVKKVNYQKTIDSLKHINERYTAAFQQYEKKNENLTRQLAKTEELLQVEKAKLTPLRKNVRRIIHSNWDTIPKETKLVKCDSLKDLVTEYEAQLTINDSLTTEKINSLNQIIQVKDEELVNCSHSYEELTQTLETSIDDSKNCSKDLQKLTKKMKRKKFFNLVLGTTVAIVSAAGAILLTVGLK